METSRRILSGLIGKRRFGRAGRMEPVRLPPHVETLVYGIGAPKCGTTWVNRFLGHHPDVSCPGPEVHYWDVIRPPRIAKYPRRIAKRLEALPEGDYRHSFATAHQALYDTPDHTAYLELLAMKNPGARVLCDISPTYGMCEARTFREMQALCPDTRFFLLLRDPLARWYSGCRYLFRDRQGPIPESEILAQFRKSARKGIPGRGRYDLTLEAADRAIPPERLLVLFYEELFTQEKVDVLCDHLGIARRPAPVAARVNAGPEGAEAGPSAAFEAEALVILEPIYRYIRQRFGDAVPESWRM